MKKKKAKRLARKIVYDRLDNASSFEGIGHSVITVDAAIELVRDVLRKH